MRRSFAIILVVALLALAGLALHFRAEAVEAQSRARTMARELADARFESKQHRERAAALETRAADLDSQLGSTKVRTTATETKAAELTRALTERQQREVALMAEIEALRQQGRVTGAPAGATLSSTGAGAPAAVSNESAYARRIAALEAQLTELLARALEAPPATVAGTLAPAEAQAASPAHQVVRVGAKDAFVILDYGAEHGARPGQQLSLGRGTSLVARVQISDVRPMFSIAQVLPDGPKRQLQTGDIVLLAQ